MSEPVAYRLGIDFGTSSTVAAMASPDGRSRFLLFDGTPVLPSAVCGQPGGGLLVGRDAVNAAPAYPDRFEASPKRCIDDGVLLLGDTEVPVVDAIAAVLRHVVDEARRVAGALPSQVALTHPVSWSSRRRDALLAAATRAGLGDVQLVPEPVAAGHYFTEVLGRHLPIGAHMLVYDLGAGTFDASVLRRVPDGFTVQASHGLVDAGGLDMDAAVMAYFAAGHAGGDPQASTRLNAPANAVDRRHNRQAWDAVRMAKESLSRSAFVVVHLSALGQDLPLGREQFEALARPVIDRTVAATRTVLLDASVPPESLYAVVLVGGASRTPLVATSLHRALGIAPTAIEQPELVVAEGALAATRPSPAAVVPTNDGLTPAANEHASTALDATVYIPRAAGRAAPAGETDVGQPAPAPEPVNGARHKRRRWIAFGAAAAVLALLGAVGVFVLDPTGQIPAINPFGFANESAGPGGPAANGEGDVDQVAASGQPAGSGPAGSGPAGSGAAPGSGPASQGAEATSRPSATAPAPKASSTSSTGTLGPVPAARSTTTDPTCGIIGLRMTRVSGSTTTWPRVSFRACVIGDPQSAYARAWIITDETTGSVELRYRWRVEARECNGGLLASKDVGPTNHSDDWVNERTVSVSSASTQAFVRLHSLEIHDKGSVWTTSGTVTSPCD